MRISNAIRSSRWKWHFYNIQNITRYFVNRRSFSIGSKWNWITSLANQPHSFLCKRVYVISLKFDTNCNWIRNKINNCISFKVHLFDITYHLVWQIQKQFRPLLMREWKCEQKKYFVISMRKMHFIYEFVCKSLCKILLELKTRKEFRSKQQQIVKRY